MEIFMMVTGLMISHKDTEPFMLLIKQNMRDNDLTASSMAMVTNSSLYIYKKKNNKNAANKKKLTCFLISKELKLLQI